MHIFCLDYTVSVSKSYPLRVQNKLTTSIVVGNLQPGGNDSVCGFLDEIFGISFVQSHGMTPLAVLVGQPVFEILLQGLITAEDTAAFHSSGEQDFVDVLQVGSQLLRIIFQTFLTGRIFVMVDIAYNLLFFFIIA